MASSPAPRSPTAASAIGQVEKLELTDDGVDVFLDIDNKYDEIPADTWPGRQPVRGRRAVRRAPAADRRRVPTSRTSSEIALEDTRTPIPTAKLLHDISTNFVSSVDKDDLRTVVTEMGAAFDDTGEDLGQIIDTSNSFIETANANFDITTALIRDSNTVLKTQLDKALGDPELHQRPGAVQHDPRGRRQRPPQGDRQRLGDRQRAAHVPRGEPGRPGSLINNLVTTGEVVVKHLNGIEQILVLYPYVVEGGFTVVSKEPGPNGPLRRPLRHGRPPSTPCATGATGAPTVARPPTAPAGT